MPNRPKVPDFDSHRQSSTKLTPRESEVLELLVNEGMDNKELGQTLGIQADTVKRHIYMLMNKLGYSTRLEMVVRTLQQRLAESQKAKVP